MIRREDLKIDVYRAGASNAVRITHLPSGRVATCSKHDSEIENTAEAYDILKRMGSRTPSIHRRGFRLWVRLRGRWYGCP